MKPSRNIIVGFQRTSHSQRTRLRDSEKAVDPREFRHVGGNRVTPRIDSWQDIRAGRERFRSRNERSRDETVVQQWGE